MNLNQRTEVFCHAVTQELVRARVAAGWSQNQLAAMSGLDQSTINLMESGKTSPTLATVFRISAALGIPASLVLENAQKATAD